MEDEIRTERKKNSIDLKQIFSFLLIYIEQKYLHWKFSYISQEILVSDVFDDSIYLSTFSCIKKPTSILIV